MISEGPGLPVLDETLGFEALAPSVAVVRHGRDKAVARRVERFELHRQPCRPDVVLPFVAESPGPLEEAGPDLADGVLRREILSGERDERRDRPAVGGERLGHSVLAELDPGLGQAEGDGEDEEADGE